MLCLRIHLRWWAQRRTLLPQRSRGLEAARLKQPRPALMQQLVLQENYHLKKPSIVKWWERRLPSKGSTIELRFPYRHGQSRSNGWERRLPTQSRIFMQEISRHLWLIEIRFRSWSIDKIDPFIEIRNRCKHAPSWSIKIRFRSRSVEEVNRCFEIRFLSWKVSSDQTDENVASRLSRKWVSFKEEPELISEHRRDKRKLKRRGMRRLLLDFRPRPRVKTWKSLGIVASHWRISNLRHPFLRFSVKADGNVISRQKHLSLKCRFKIYCQIDGNVTSRQNFLKYFWLAIRAPSRLRFSSASEWLILLRHFPEAQLHAAPKEVQLSQHAEISRWDLIINGKVVSRLKSLLKVYESCKDRMVASCQKASSSLMITPYCQGSTRIATQPLGPDYTYPRLRTPRGKPSRLVIDWNHRLRPSIEAIDWSQQFSL